MYKKLLLSLTFVGGLTAPLFASQQRNAAVAKQFRTYSAALSGKNGAKSMKTIAQVEKTIKSKAVFKGAVLKLDGKVYGLGNAAGVKNARKALSAYKNKLQAAVVAESELAKLRAEHAQLREAFLYEHEQLQNICQEFDRLVKEDNAIKAKYTALNRDANRAIVASQLAGQQNVCAWDSFAALLEKTCSSFGITPGVVVPAQHAAAPTPAPVAQAPVAAAPVAHVADENDNNPMA